MLTVSHTNGPTFNRRSHTQNASPRNVPTPHPDLSQESTTTPKPPTVDRLNALPQMQTTDPFCKCISKCLLNGKAPHHEFDTFTHVKGLLYKHVTDSGKQFLALVIPKSWKYTVLVEAHNKLGHQCNSCTYCLIKRQYCWKEGIKTLENILQTAYFADVEKAKVQQYPLQMTEIPDRPFDKIAIDFVTECETHQLQETNIS